MKKALCLVLFAALLFSFAACAKKRTVYVEPPTEVVTLEDGRTEVYEIVTDESGETVTDEQGSTKVVPYDPPVTEKGGYLVTDAQGSTIKQSATTTVVPLENDDVVINDTAVYPGTTAAPETSVIVKPDGQTQIVVVPTTQPSSKPGAPTTAPATTASSTEAPTSSVAITGELTKEKAKKLYEILDIENGFEADLVEGDFKAAQSSLKTYVALIDLAVKSIKADEQLRDFVGVDNLNMWRGNMLTAQQKYNVFITMADRAEVEGKKSELYFTAYTDFQTYYRYSLDAYYTMQLAAQKYM